MPRLLKFDIKNMYKVNNGTGQPLSPRSSAPMLSEVIIKLPKPQSFKKVSTYHDSPEQIESPRHT